MVDVTDYAERAALIEYEAGISRAEAERRAWGEILDGCLSRRPDGILGELVLADRRRRDAAMQDALAAAGLVRCRAPAWGFGHVIADGRTWRPAAAGEAGRAAAIVPATDDGALVDLVAQDLETGQMRTRLDVAAIVGADEVEAARAEGRPLLIFATATTWLRSGCRGACIVDWRRAGRALDGVPAILAPERLVEPIARATAECHPRPFIARPAGEARHAAA